jgi:hypothetical protein
MDRQTHLMINDAGFNAEPSKSPWSSLADSLVGAAGDLYDQRGNIVEGVGQWYEGQVEGQAGRTMGSQYDALETSYGLQAGWAGVDKLVPEVQGRVIELQALADRSVAMDKWIGRYAATRTGYAAAGIAVDVGTPVMMTGQLLKSLDEELKQIDLNRSIREFNEVTIPLARAEVQQIQAEHGGRQAESQARLARETGETQEKLGLAKAIATGFNVISELF